MKNFYQSILLGLLSVLFSCTSGNEETLQVPQEIIDNSLEFFDGEVLETKMEQEEGLDAWEIKIQNQEGSIVSFYWTVAGSTLFKIDGQTGPFDYDLLPGNNLISFTTAKTPAFAAVKDDTLNRWELAQEDKFINKWVYTFEIGSQKVFVDAENGDILEID